ncbi:MAG: hypothetical protein MZW92_02530 [Comamonadaceae bacterium]|nr:hypothetical protein [Comamonadaceae bacterium]
MEVGGYLTVATFKKDTVGEDMELVVRITRRAMERKLAVPRRFRPQRRLLHRGAQQLSESAQAAQPLAARA